MISFFDGLEKLDGCQLCDPIYDKNLAEEHIEEHDVVVEGLDGGENKLFWLSDGGIFYFYGQQLALV